MKVALRTDGTAVIMDAPMGPYHVASKQDDPYGKYDLDELLQYATAHPEDVVEEPVEPTPAINTSDMVRAERNRLLAACDWTQVADAPVEKTAWAIYRAALRDIPQQPGFPDEITWPDRP